MPYEPSDAELAAYISKRLAHLGDHASEPDFIADLIAHYRRYWTMLFQIDHDPDGIELDSFRQSLLGDG